MKPVGDRPVKGRRRRRSREDVTARIRNAAKQLFAERGYNGTTTREVARLADVSETLLFRYYGTKATLFDEVVAQPFNRVMQDFPRHYSRDAEREAAEHRNFDQVYTMFVENRALFSALLANEGQGGEQPSFAGIMSFLDAASEQQMQKYAALGEEPPFDIGVAMRLAFGMLASSVLMRDWLFPDGAPPRETIVGMVETLVKRALDPGADG